MAAKWLRSSTEMPGQKDNGYSATGNGAQIRVTMDLASQLFGATVEGDDSWRNPQSLMLSL
jgi:hypothetical protein